MRRSSTLLLLAGLLTLGPVGAVTAQADSTVTYDTLGHLMVVGVAINDSEEEYNFAIDTGGLTFIDKAVADRFGLKQQAMMAKIDSMDVSGFPIEKVFCFTTFDFSHFDALGTPIHGIIGSNLLDRYKVTFDFKARTVTFSGDTTALRAPEGGVLLPFRNHPVNNAPLIAMTIGGQPLEGMIDTGQPNPLVLPLETFDEYRQYCLPGYLESDGLMEEWPMATTDYNYLARLESLGFGETVFDSVVCLFGEPPKMLSMPLIGSDLLTQFKMVINYPRDEILLTPYDDGRLTPNRFSVGFRPDISEDGRVVVKALWQDSPAAKAGLERGDVIVSFEAVKAAPANMIHFIDLLGDDDIKTITLEVAEGDSTKTITIEKAMLF